jgi:hypothetical protein
MEDNEGDDVCEKMKHVKMERKMNECGGGAKREARANL